MSEKKDNKPICHNVLKLVEACPYNFPLLKKAPPHLIISAIPYRQLILQDEVELNLCFEMPEEGLVQVVKGVLEQLEPTPKDQVLELLEQIQRMLRECLEKK